MGQNVVRIFAFLLFSHVGFNPKTYHHHGGQLAYMSVRH